MSPKKKIDLGPDRALIGPVVAIASAHGGGTFGEALYALDQKGVIWMLKGSYSGRVDCWELCSMIAKIPQPPRTKAQEAAWRKAREQDLVKAAVGQTEKKL